MLHVQMTIWVMKIKDINLVYWSRQENHQCLKEEELRLYIGWVKNFLEKLWYTEVPGKVYTQNPNSILLSREEKFALEKSVPRQWPDKHFTRLL